MEDRQRLEEIINELNLNREPMRRDVLKALSKSLDIIGENTGASIRNYYEELKVLNAGLYNTCLYNEGPKSALNVSEIKAYYEPDSKTVNGYEVLNKYFDELFETNKKVVAFGEDLGFRA